MRRKTWLVAAAVALALSCGDGADPADEAAPADADPSPATRAGDESASTARPARAGRAPDDERGVEGESGRFRRYRTHRFDPGLDPEQRALIEQLEALGYAAGSAPAPAAAGVTVHDASRSYPGYNLYTSGHAPEALLTDMDGRVLHRWRRSFRSIWPDYPIDDANVKTRYLRRAHLYPNGDVLAIFEGLGIVKLDRDSNVLWEDPGRQHHDLDVAPNGDVYLITREARIVPRIDPEEPILEDFIVVFDAAGAEKARVSMLEAFERSPYQDVWPQRKSSERDIFHTNSIHVLDGRLADRLPAFRAGNVLTSMRSLDAIAVVDLELGQVVWRHFGEYALQHDPTVLDDGGILLFDNLGQPEASAILEYQPETMKVRWSYRGSATEPFFSRSCGTVARLPNGNTLVTESDNGRAFELDAAHEIVWEFLNPNRATGEAGEEFIATLFEMVRLRSDFPVDWADGPAAAPAP